ncbi:DUF2848 family protein [Georgenia subflava]|uniref:DUF2848 domain-containing protein n=1 Tax=Georgenia subflava TaxID=1622177 RepID=A0A6N7EJN9_9MICO|nr:DUF2848 family protein [Georgenia subflava]MPV35504.1 DUF2848 domain-containing protein [Georgenia subflava]
MKLVELDLDTVRRTRVVVAGYTGRDEAQVRHHIEELARIGVAPPANVPEFYPMPDGALTFGTDVDVDGDRTSGEVEPVLVRLGGKLHLALGSDHTDRAREAAEGVAVSKACCPKPLARYALACDAAELDAVWDGIELSGLIDGDPYQEGVAAALRPLTQILAALDDRDGTAGEDLVLYGGTVPLIGGDFRYGDAWNFSLTVAEHRLTLDYRTRVRATEGATHG